MIIFGWGKRTIKNYGELPDTHCWRCKNSATWELRRYMTWITLFFVPIIPYKIIYAKVCPICGNVEELTREVFDMEVANYERLKLLKYGPIDEDDEDEEDEDESDELNQITLKKHKKNVPERKLTETQRHYLEQMKELEEERGHMN